MCAAAATACAVRANRCIASPGRRCPPGGPAAAPPLAAVPVFACLAGSPVFPFDHHAVQAGPGRGGRHASSSSSSSSGGGPGCTISASVGDILCTARLHARQSPRSLPSARAAVPRLTHSAPDQLIDDDYLARQHAQLRVRHRETVWAQDRALESSMDGFHGPSMARAWPASAA